MINIEDVIKEFPLVELQYGDYLLTQGKKPTACIFCIMVLLKL